MDSRTLLSLVQQYCSDGLRREELGHITESGRIETAWLSVPEAQMAEMSFLTSAIASPSGVTASLIISYFTQMTHMRARTWYTTFSTYIKT